MAAEKMEQRHGVEIGINLIIGLVLSIVLAIMFALIFVGDSQSGWTRATDAVMEEQLKTFRDTVEDGCRENVDEVTRRPSRGDAPTREYNNPTLARAASSISMVSANEYRVRRSSGEGEVFLGTKWCDSVYICQGVGGFNCPAGGAITELPVNLKMYYRLRPDGPDEVWVDVVE